MFPLAPEDEERLANLLFEPLCEEDELLERLPSGDVETLLSDVDTLLSVQPSDQARLEKLLNDPIPEEVEMPEGDGFAHAIEDRHRMAQIDEQLAKLRSARTAGARRTFTDTQS